MKPINLTGHRFGRWTALRRVTNTKQGQARWLCVCDCGVKRALKSILLRRGISKSCGCLRSEVTTSRSTIHGHSPAGRPTPTYRCWQGMINRCTNLSDKRFADYGGRGIKVCVRWLESFQNFLTDMGECPPGKTIDRYPDMNGDYTPENCRWATSTEQGRNKRNNRLLTHDGKTLCVSEWAEVLKIPATVLHMRLFQGWTVERTLTTPRLIRPDRFKKTFKPKQ